jgi:signal peptidase I
VEMQSSSLEGSQQENRSYKRLWCAILSGAIPGLGDWLLGNRKRAALFLSLFAATLLCYWPLRIPRFYWPLLLLAVVGSIIHIVSACCTFLLGRSDRDRAANWWILVLIPLAYVFAGVEDTGQLRASGFQIFSIESDSMSPTILIHDHVVVDRWYFRHVSPRASDVVAFRHQGFYLVKRVIAANGSTIEGIHGQVKVDGALSTNPISFTATPIIHWTSAITSVRSS